jgi:hypothetical protein
VKGKTEQEEQELGRVKAGGRDYRVPD